LLSWLERADDSLLKKTGRHASLRILSVEEIVGVLAQHDRDHAADIARVLHIEVPSA
jgi:hypothetical protein